MLDFVVYLLYRAGSAIIAAVPLRVLFAVGQLLGVCAWVISGKYRRLAKRNVAIAFGNEKSQHELRRFVRRHFQRLGANLLCGVKLCTMPPEKILRHVEVENVESMASRFRAGVPVVLILSHLGIWELFAQLMPKFVGFVRNASVYQGLGNRFIDEHVRRTRSQTGLELFDRHDGFEPVIELLAFRRRRGCFVGSTRWRSRALDAVFRETGVHFASAWFTREAHARGGHRRCGLHHWSSALAHGVHRAL